MNKSIRWLLFLVLLLGLSSLACGLFTDDAEPAEPATESSGEQVASDSDEAPAAAEPSEEESSPPETEIEPEPTAETAQPTEVESIESAPEESNEAPVSDLQTDLDVSSLSSDFNFDSYRFTIDMSFTGTDSSGNEITQIVEANIAYVADPPATEMLMRLEGVEGVEEFAAVTMSQVGGTNYMSVPGFGCITNDADEGDLLDDNPIADLVDPDQFLEDVQGAEYAGEEVVNGIPTSVYTFDETFLDASEEVEWAEGSLYVAKEGNYVVRLVMDGEGALNMLDEGANQTGTMHIEFNLSDVNQPIEIGIPADCAGESESGFTLPMLVDAYEVSSFSGFMSYQTNVTVQEAVDFYEEVMANEGWVKNEAESFEMAGTAILTFDQAGETVSVTIGENEEGGGSFVMAIEEGEE